MLIVTFSLHRFDDCVLICLLREIVPFNIFKKKEKNHVKNIIKPKQNTF